ncbi:MAG: hypothetical protein P8Y54_12970, partial [Xanthomonadales bacterium]
DTLTQNETGSRWPPAPGCGDVNVGRVADGARGPSGRCGAPNAPWLPGSLKKPAQIQRVIIRIAVAIGFPSTFGPIGCRQKTGAARGARRPAVCGVTGSAARHTRGDFSQA